MSNLYYLVKSGEVKKKAQEYINLMIENTDVIRDKVKAVGGTRYQMGFDGRLRGISFPTVGFTLSKEWKNIKNGVSFPRKGTDTFNSLKEISLPNSTDMMKGVLDFPLSISWENEDERGRSSFRAINPIQVLWCNDMDDIAIYMPDVNKKIEALKGAHPDALLSINQWSPPNGLAQITEAKWEFMLAGSRIKAEERQAVDWELKND